MKHTRALRLLAGAVTALSAMSALADGVKISAIALQPNPPVMGKNAFDLTLSDASGKPVAGAKITASVAMTSMDMGTTHPAVKEVGKGHYKTTVAFSMEGPWRVTFIGSGAAASFKQSFDFQPGSKKAWSMPAVKPAETEVSTIPANPPVKSDNRPPQPVPPVTPSPIALAPSKPIVTPPPAAPGMTMTMLHDSTGMPQLAEKMVVKAAPGMDLAKNAGYGQNAPMVAMMTLMMVGGSGMEGMKMPPMDMVFNEATFSGQGGEPAMGDMSMDDMNMSGALKVTAKLDKATVGDNNVRITIATKDGKPVTGAKITTSVAMTSMDMGTTHPAVKELGKGQYATKASFNMQGPWRLVLTVTLPKAKPSTYHFDFQAK